MEGLIPTNPEPMNSRLPSLAVAAAAAMITQAQLQAQSNWIGTGTIDSPAQWSDDLNWFGTLPENDGTTSLVFLNILANSFSTNDLTGLTVSSITIPANDGAPVPTNIKDNTVVGNGINLAGTFTVNTGNWQFFNLNMALGNASRTFAISTGRLYLGGVLSGTAAITKTSGGDLYLANENTLTGNGTNTVNSSIAGAGSYSQALLFSGGGSGTVVLTHPAALGGNTNSVRFSGGGSGTLDLQTNTSVTAYSVFSGSGNGGTIIANRATAGAGLTHSLGVLDLSSVGMTINSGGNVTSGTAGVGFVALSMSGGNDNNPVTLAGSAMINIGPAGITNNTNTTRRLMLAGTNTGNTIGVVADLAPGATAGSGKVNLIKANTSTWTMTGANTYSGTTTISGGTLQLGNGGASGSLNPLSILQNGGTLAINRSGTITQGTDIPSTIAAYTPDYSTNAAGVAITPVFGKLVKSGSGNLILTGANVLAPTDALTFSGSGSGTVTLTNTSALGAAGNTIRFSGGGSGILDLQTDTSVNAYGIASGTFNGATITANRATSGAGITHVLGTLELSSVTLTTHTGGNVASGTAGVSFTELKMSGGNDFNPVTLAGTATYTLGSASITSNGFAKRLQLDGTSTANTVTGIISDTNNATAGAVVHLIKANSGTWTLGGNNTYTGTTTVNGGTLLVNGNQSSANGAVTVTAGTLGGTGSTGGAVNVATGATIAPGTASTIGQFTASNGVILASGAAFDLDIDADSTTSDTLVVTGDLDLTGAVLAAQDLGSSAPSPSAVFTLATYTGSLTGTFAGLPDGATTTINGNSYTIKYADGGHNITLTAVAAGSAFASWAQANITDLAPGADATATGDPDGDGTNNLSEFALHGNPLSGSDNGYVDVMTTPVPGVGNALVLTFATRTGTVFSGSLGSMDGVTYSAQGSLNLADDFTSAVTEVVPALVPLDWPAAGGGYEYHSFRLDVSTGLPSTGFLRVGVSE